MAVFERKLLLQVPIVHFHDYGRKEKFTAKILKKQQVEKNIYHCSILFQSLCFSFHYFLTFQGLVK